MERLEKLKNLLAMATADGTMSEGEIRYLSERSARWGLTDSQFAEAIQYALTHRGELHIPSRPAERKELLRDLLRMMVADGQLPEVEKRLFATAAAVMEVSQDEVNDLIDDLLQDQDFREPKKR